MKQHARARIGTIVLLATLVAASFPAPVYAQAILTVTPTDIVNDVANTITVRGTGFDNTAVVHLDGGALDTVVRNAQTLTAIVPAGLTPGAHEITVSMTGVTVAGSATLNVIA